MRIFNRKFVILSFDGDDDDDDDDDNDDDELLLWNG